MLAKYMLEKYINDIENTMKVSDTKEHKGLQIIEYSLRCAEYLLRATTETFDEIEDKEEVYLFDMFRGQFLKSDDNHTRDIHEANLYPTSIAIEMEELNENLKIVYFE